MVLGVPRFHCVLLLIGLLVLSIGTVGCGGGAAASTTPGGTTPPQSADLSISPTSVDFAQQTVNTASGAQSITVRNPGTTSVGISSITVDGDFTQSNNCGTAIAASSTCTVAVVFGPAATGARAGTVQITETSGKIHKIPVKGSGIAGQLAATPASLDFGSVGIGQNSTQSLTLTNAGAANLTIASVNASGAGFSVSSATLPLVLAKGTSTTLNVTFTPSAAGSASGSIAVVSSASATPFTVAAVGTGVTPGQLVADATNLAFGNITIGQSSSKTVKITNTGGADVSVNVVQVDGTGYSVSGVTAPFIMTPGASSTVNLKFAPTAGGLAYGTLYVRSSAGTMPLMVYATGTGVGTGQLTVNPTALDFGSVTAGQTSAKSVTLSNTGSASLTVSSVTTASAGYSVSGITLPLTLAAGANTTFNVTFAPSTSGSATGSVSISSSAATQPLTVSLTGTGSTPGQLTSNPTSVDFGSVTVGQSKNQTVTLTNTGGTSLSVTSVSTTGTGFSATAGTLPLTIAAGASKTVTVTFSSSSSGSVSGSLSVGHSASANPLTVALTAVGAAGVAQLSANPTSLAFGNIYVGQSSSKSVTLSNTGNASLSITRISTDGPGFSASGLTVPFTLAAGGSTSFNVMFSPTSAGSASGNVYINDSIASPDVTIPLTGTGAATTPHSVSLLWTGSTTTTVVGYNVYRATQDGGPYTRINSATEQYTNYSDSSVQNGTTYYYVVTAVDNNSTESAYSNQSGVNVPVQ